MSTTNAYKVPTRREEYRAILLSPSTKGEILLAEVKKHLMHMCGTTILGTYGGKDITSLYFAVGGIQRGVWNRRVKPKLLQLARRYRCQFVMFGNKPAHEELEFELKKIPPGMDEQPRRELHVNTLY